MVFCFHHPVDLMGRWGMGDCGGGIGDRGWGLGVGGGKSAIADFAIGVFTQQIV